MTLSNPDVCSGVKHRQGLRAWVLHFLQLPESFRYLHCCSWDSGSGLREGKLPVAACCSWNPQENITGQSRLLILRAISSVMKQEIPTGNNILISKLYARRLRVLCSRCLKLPPGEGHDGEGISWFPLLPVNIVYS